VTVLQNGNLTDDAASTSALQGTSQHVMLIDNKSHLHRHRHCHQWSANYDTRYFDSDYHDVCSLGFTQSLTLFNK